MAYGRVRGNRALRSLARAGSAAIAAMLCACAGANAPAGGTNEVSTPAGVRLRSDTTWYEVSGSTRAEWLAAMRAGAPLAGVRGGYLASTTWRWQWRGTPRADPGGCAYTHPTVEVDLSFIMPRLHADSASAEDSVEWLRFTRALWIHESGHALRASRAGAELRDAIVRLSAPTCATLQERAARAYQTIQSKYTTLQSDYDARTRHGARQGALLVLGNARNPLFDSAFRDTVP